MIATPAALGERVGLRLRVDHRGGAGLRLGGGAVRDVEAHAVDRRGARDHGVIEHVGDLRQVANGDRDRVLQLVAGDLLGVRLVVVDGVERDPRGLDVLVVDAQRLERRDDLGHRLGAGLARGLRLLALDEDAQVDRRHVGHDRDLAAARDGEGVVGRLAVRGRGRVHDALRGGHGAEHRAGREADEQGARGGQEEEGGSTGGGGHLGVRPIAGSMPGAIGGTRHPLATARRRRRAVGSRG